MMQAKKINYDVIGLTETRRRHPLNAVHESGKELFLGTCNSRGVFRAGVLVNTSIAQNMDSFEQLTTRIGRLRMSRRGPTPALPIFVVYAPASSYEEDVQVFYMDLEKFYQKDHAFYNFIIGDFNAKLAQEERLRKFASGPTAYNRMNRGRGSQKFTERNPRTIINWDLFATLAGFREDSAIHNIDEEYGRLGEHLHDCTKKAESFKTAKRRLSLETLELIRQRRAARAAGKQELTSELARLCREAIKGRP
ncbi:hypothetical protein RB195_022797 [Necator americanus]|uniref:Endonuclease/exonuclease/phosphatase domain-containing protein n=1 Tax=Necator americanus TaxID=51031 RepID=A0ABR1EGU9_NECAM